MVTIHMVCTNLWQMQLQQLGPMKLVVLVQPLPRDEHIVGTAYVQLMFWGIEGVQIYRCVVQIW